MISMLVAVATTSALALPMEPLAAQDSSTQPADPEVIQLRERVSTLEARINEFMAKEETQWLSEERAAQIRSIVADALADADTRSSLEGSGAMAGWDKGFFLQSADGAFRMVINGQIQFRYVWNHQNDSPTDDYRYGFEVRRSKLSFKGHMFDPSWQYELELDSNRTSGDMQLGENVWVLKDLGNGFAVRAGQFKPFYLREENVSSRRLLAVERSMVNGFFSAGVAQGVQVSSTHDRWRVMGAYIDGFGTGGASPYTVEDNEYAFTARGEFLAWGDWKAIEDDNPFRGGTDALLFGVAASTRRQEYGTGDNLPPPDFNNAEFDASAIAADITWKTSGFTLAAWGIYQKMRTNDDGVMGAFDYDQYGAVVRGGVFVSDDIELYAMYEWGETGMPNTSNLSALTVGFNWFFHRNDIKWSSDIGYGFNPVAAPWAGSGGTGWRADSPGEDGQIVIRSQIQLLF